MCLNKRRTKLAFIFLYAVLAGCATNRSEISLSSPLLPSEASAFSEQTAVIRSIKDERIFEQAPRDPSIPSLGFEGATQASAETKARAVGRKRNTYGMALGDILLQSGQTVESVIRENLSAALVQAGYQIKDADAADESALIIDVRIRQFWAWFQPGFWAITLNTNIVTDLTLSGITTPVTISVHAQDARQLATEGAWKEIIGQALDDYQAQVVGRTSELP